jgi:hypothetical protein
VETQETPITAEPFAWEPISEDDYHYALEVMWPAVWAGSCFLMGEPMDHRGAGDSARFLFFGKGNDGEHYRGSRPVTCTEFRTLPRCWVVS